MGKAQCDPIETLGRSHGGFTTKLHATCDGKGRPLSFVLTPGEAHDVKGFGPLFRMIADKARALHAVREEIAFHGI
jgi:transposase